MKEFIIEENEAGQRFDKYLAKLLKEAPKSFFYKMLRKKNITLNNRKATGNEKLLKGDTIKLFLSDETFDKFAGTTQVARAYCNLDIIYEDSDIIIINKPAGMLSQPADDGKPSLVEYLIGYLLKKGELTEEEKELIKSSGCAWGCDICQNVCPLNKNASPTDIDEFLSSSNSNVTTDTPIEGRAFAWRGEKVIKRNLEILEED